MKYSNCAILVNSCDAYSDTWEPFFKILRAQWPDCDMPVYLNTEIKSFRCEEFDICVLNQMPTKKNIEWGERLLDCLSRIKEDYILFLLEDFFFEKPVRSQKVLECLEWIKRDKSIAVFNFSCAGLSYHSDYNNETNGSIYPGFCKRDKKNDRYLLAANPSIWRKSDLISFIKPFESPWVWELYGSERVKKSSKEFYCKLLNEPDIFAYDNRRGGAIHRGKWVGVTVRPLFEKYNINIDLDKRGVIEDWTLSQPINKTSLKKKVNNFYNRIRSLYF